MTEETNGWSLHVVGVEGGNNRDVRHKSKEYIKDQLIKIIIHNEMYYSAFGYDRYFRSCLDAFKKAGLVNNQLKPVIENEVDFEVFLKEHLQIADQDYCLCPGYTYIISRHSDYIIDKLHIAIRQYTK